MIPHRLTLHNFMCYGDATLDFDNLHLACISGENGHGKSAILDAITWALWGKSRAQHDDDLIRLGETEMAVEFEFGLGPNRYRVLRKRKSDGRGSSALEVQIQDGEAFRAITGDSIRDSQAEINRTLRMEYETFINSAFLVQGRADEFTTKAPAERKRVLGEILDLSFYDRCEEAAKIKAKESRTEAVAIEAAIVEMDRELGQKETYQRELTEETEKAELLETEWREVQEQVREAQGKVTEATVKRQNLIELRGDLDRRSKERDVFLSRIRGVDPAARENCQKKIEQVREALAQLEGLGERKDRHHAEIQRISEEMAGLSATNEALKADMAALKEEMDLLERADANCPLCDSELTEQHREEILAQKQTDGKAKANAYRENKEIIEGDQKELHAWKQDLSEIERQINSERGLRVQEAELTGQLAKLEAEQERLEEWTEQATALEATIASMKEKVTELEHEVRDAEQLAVGLREMQAKSDKLNEDASWARRRVGAAQQKLDHCDYLQKQKVERLEEQRKAHDQQAIYEELRVSFGKKGIQAMIIEAAIPEIEDGANRLLGRMSDGQMRVAFNSQRETLKGDTVETLGIEVADEMGARDYALFSGGERFRINFAVRIAISQLLARRAGAQLQSLIIDEGFGTQDASGRERLVEAISSVQEDFARILVITHIDELRDAFPNRIDVVKGPAGSLISVN